MGHGWLKAGPESDWMPCTGGRGTDATWLDAGCLRIISCEAEAVLLYHAGRLPNPQSEMLLVLVQEQREE